MLILNNFQKKLKKLLLNLNTSYVDIKRFNRFNRFNRILHLNTSYVDIKLNVINEHLKKLEFKYILC